MRSNYLCYGRLQKLFEHWDEIELSKQTENDPIRKTASCHPPQIEESMAMPTLRDLDDELGK